MYLLLVKTEKLFLEKYKHRYTPRLHNLRQLITIHRLHLGYRSDGLTIRTQELCESRGGRPGLPVPNSPYGLCGRSPTFLFFSLFKSCTPSDARPASFDGAQPLT